MVSRVHNGSLAVSRGPWKKHDGGTSNPLANSNKELARMLVEPLSYLWIF
jgi:hypothetical protein